MSYSVDIFKINDLVEDKIHKYIRKKIKKRYKEAEKDYLLQCAYWSRSDFNDILWIARSPTESSYGDYRPIFDIDVEYASKTKLKFQSWKADYDTVKYSYNPY